MKERLAGVIVLAGLLLSVAGAVLGHENIKVTGNLILLITATVAGYRFLIFSVLTPVHYFRGTCIGQKRFPSHYVLSFRTGGAGTYSGRASLQLGERIKMGDRVEVKVKGPIILDINKLD